METQAREDLAVIRRLMEESQRVICDNGAHFILWGALSTAALLVTHGVVTLGWPIHLGWVWGIPVAVGWALSFWIGRRSQGRARATTAAGQILAGIWIGFGIGITLLFFAGFFGGTVPGRGMGGIAAALLGTAYFASGFVPGQGALRHLAVGWWLGSLVMFLAPGLYTLLLMAGLVVVLQIAPGFVLYRRARAQMQQAAA